MSMSPTTPVGSTGATATSHGGGSSADSHADGQGMQAITDHAGATATAVKGEANSVAQSAADHARSLLGSAGDELREQGRSRTDQLCQMLGQASDDFARMAEHADAASPAGRTVRSMATTTGQLAKRLGEGGLEGVMADTSRFARRRPGTFLALAAAAGFGVGRLARSSDTQAVSQAIRSSDSGDSAETVPLGGQP